MCLNLGIWGKDKKCQRKRKSLINSKRNNNKNAEGQAFQGTTSALTLRLSHSAGSERATGFQSTLKCLHFLSYSGRITTVLWRCHGPSNFNRHFFFSFSFCLVNTIFSTCPLRKAPYCGLKVYEMSLAMTPNQCPSLLHLNPLYFPVFFTYLPQKIFLLESY